MEIERLQDNEQDLDSVMSLFVECFQNDHYYAKMFPDCTTRPVEMRREFTRDIKYCLKNGRVYGIHENAKLVAFEILFDYKKMLFSSPDAFQHVFEATVENGHIVDLRDKSEKRLHEKLSLLNKKADIMFLLSIAVSENYQRRRIASKLVDWAIADNAGSYLVSDISNRDSLPIYKKYGFTEEKIGEDYFLVIREPDIIKGSEQYSANKEQFSFLGLVKIIVPDIDVFDQHELFYGVCSKEIKLRGIKKADRLNTKCFLVDKASDCTGFLITITYKSLLHYQRYINLSHYDEKITSHNNLIYILNPWHDYDNLNPGSEECGTESQQKELLFNDNLISMIKRRKNEWDVIPDVFVSTPVSYNNLFPATPDSVKNGNNKNKNGFLVEYTYLDREKDFLKNNSFLQLNKNAKEDDNDSDYIDDFYDLSDDVINRDFKSAILLDDLYYRTYYEDGVPILDNDINTAECGKKYDSASGLKKRIRRYYLGRIKIKITDEITVNQYEKPGNTIGQPAYVDMILSIDDNSNCAVLTWYSLSTPFLLSHLMDNIIRNQVYTLAEHDGKYEWINMYQYIGEQYGLSKKGSPKIFVTIPESRECLTNSQKASILASETIYPDNENMGSIIDSTITSLIDKNQGMGQGQYDRATVYAYSNVLLQFTPSFKKSVSDRLWEEAVTQFYIESTLFEETAIEIADSDITEALESVSGSDRYEAIADLTAFLSHVSVIYDNYSRTIDFWDRQVKYPSSQESLDMIRKAFKIDQKLAYLRRDQEQLQTVFRTKSNAIDREDSKREGNALALLAILAVFSAWCDSFSFVDNFKTMFSDKWGLYIPQIIIFIIVLILAFIAIWQLFSISDFIRKLKDKRKDRQ